MWIIKKLFIIAVVFWAAALFSGEAWAEKKIGLLIWTEEERFAGTWHGFMEQLEKDGFGEAQVKFTIENAKGNKAKAAELARKFASAKMDMIIVLGTPSAVVVAKEIKEVPVVFSWVYDPIEAGIAGSWNSSGNNTTGTSSKVPVSKLMGSLKQLSPVKKLAVLYTDGEKNSEIQLKELQEIQAYFQVRILPVPLNRKEDVAVIIPEVTRSVDAIFLSGSSVVGEAATMIVNIANKAKVLTVTHIEDLVAKGVLLGVCADPFSAGRLAGKKAVKILKGAKPSSIPIEMLKNFDVLINMKTAKAGQFQIPPKFMKRVTRTIE